MSKTKSRPGGGAIAEFCTESGQTVMVEIRGLTGTKALGHLNALEKILNGALVLDGDELRRIDASLLSMADKAGPATKGYLLDLRVPLQRAAS